MYHSDISRIGKSGLDLIAKNPAYYYAKYLDPNRERETQTPALVVGSAFHAMVLEPWKFKELFAVMPLFSGTGSVARKELWINDNRGKDFISLEAYDQISRMRDSIMKHPLVPELLEIGEAEQRLDWEEPGTGALCKAKPDFRNTKSGLIIDLKTTEDASEEGFGRSAYKYRYHVQAPFYCDGAFMNGLDPSGFVFIAVEKSYPYQVNVFYADEEFMALGRRTYMQNLETYMECKRTNSWPGYSPEIKPLRLPRWAANNM